MFRVINQPDTFAQHAQTQADVGIFGQAVFVPATNELKKVPVDKDGIPPEWNHTDLCMEVEPALEPEKVFHTVVNSKPVIAEVHELNPGLDDPNRFLQHNRVDYIEDVGVNIILGVKNRHHLILGAPQADVESMRFINRQAREGFNTDAWRSNIIYSPLCLSNRVRIIDVANHSDFQQMRWVIGCPDELDRLVNHCLLMPRW